MIEAGWHRALNRAPNRARLLIFLAAALPFIATLRNDFLELDDRRIIVEQRFLHELTPLSVLACFSPWPIREEYLPLRDFSYMLGFAISEDTALIALGNIALHGLAAVALFGLARRLFGQDDPAFAAALLFAVHPVHLESVAWLSGRKDVLSGLFFILTLSAYLDLRAASHLAQRRRRLARALVLYCAALLSKATVVSLPLLLLATELLLPARQVGPRLRDRALALLPFVLLTGAFVKGYTAMLRSWGAAHSALLRELPPDPIKTLLFTNAAVINEYLLVLVAPLQQRFFSEQPYRNSLDLEVGAGLAVISALSVLALYGARVKDPLALFLAWFGLALIPCLGLVHTGILYAERYLYLPSIGFVLLIAELTERLRRRLSSGLAVPSLLLPYLAILALLTALRAPDFRDGGRLWRRVLADEPRNTVALVNLGVWAFDRDPALARSLFERALEVRPDKRAAAFDLGQLAAREGRWEDALEAYRRSARIDPRYLPPVYGAAAVLRKLGRVGEALAIYDALRAARPTEGPRAAFERALALEESGAKNEALRAWRELIDSYGAAAAAAPFVAEARRRSARP